MANRTSTSIFVFAAVTLLSPQANALPLGVAGLLGACECSLRDTGWDVSLEPLCYRCPCLLDIVDVLLQKLHKKSLSQKPKKKWGSSDTAQQVLSIVFVHS
jgi:hypothetical protein